MILKLRSLLFTSASMDTDWVSLVLDDGVCGGVYATGRFLLLVPDAPAGAVWISNQHPECQGEGMQTTAEKLERFLLEEIQLPAADGALTAELPRGDLDRLVGEFYAREF